MANLDQISEAIGRIEGLLESYIQEHSKAHDTINARLNNGRNGHRDTIIQGTKAGGIVVVLVAVVEVIKALAT